jgi:hypothetical protein
MKLAKIIRLNENGLDIPQREESQIEYVQKDYQRIRRIVNPSEAVQLAAVNSNAYSFKYIKNPSEAVQLAAVSKVGSTIRYCKNPSNLVLTTALKNQGFVNNEEKYESFIKKYFKDNAILMKKWLRYGETMRSYK